MCIDCGDEGIGQRIDSISQIGNHACDGHPALMPRMKRRRKIWAENTKLNAHRLRALSLRR
jgi:hypothetical protein